MVLDIILEILAYLGFRAFKKKKKTDTDLTSLETVDPNQEKDESRRTFQEGVSVCAGCSRIVKKGAIYEQEKTWCMECYKTNVLKVLE
jgi:protein-arginine kinase activator protein McsA